MRRLTWVPLAALAAACYTGPSESTFEPAHSPRGMDVTLSLRNGQVRGELLEVRDTAMLLMRGQQVVLVPNAAIRRIGTHKYSLLPYTRGAPGAEARRKLRVVSRFPGGLAEPVLRQLLSQVGQPDVVTIGSP